MKTQAIESPLSHALDFDSYQWMVVQAPHLLSAIESELERGRSPAEIRFIVSSRVGSDRQALALRAEQVARYILAITRD